MIAAAAPVALAVIAKQPLPGRCKTRLCPPLEPPQAAALAEAALADTLAAVGQAEAGRRVLVLEGEPGPWLPPGFELIRQSSGGLAQRLGAAFEAIAEPALLIGMDTPQVSAAAIDRATAELRRPGVDAVLGAAEDGGYWAIGLQRPRLAVFDGVPMSSPATVTAQRRRLRELGLRFAELETMRDVDTFEDARVVAARAPWTNFARRLRRLEWATAGAV